MKDYITPKERLSNPNYKWITEGFKELSVTITLITIFLFLITQPGVLI